MPLRHADDDRRACAEETTLYRQRDVSLRMSVAWATARRRNRRHDGQALSPRYFMKQIKPRASFMRASTIDINWRAPNES